MSQQYADIIVDISSEKLDRTFQYRVPEHLKGRITEGMVVRIPFGRGDREISGYVIGLSHAPKFDEAKTKEIICLENSQETVESRLIALAAWMRENYGSTMIQALKTVLPVKKQIAKNEPWSKIHADNPTITEEDFVKFLENCEREEVKAKSEKMKALQARNTPRHHLRSRGYEGKRHVWAKEDAERESHGIPHPLAEFTDPQERDWILARH